MRCCLLLLLVMLLAPFKGICQDDRAKYFTDVRDAKDDSVRMMRLIDLGYSVYAGSKPDSAIYYYDKAFAIARRLKNVKGMLRYYACYGDILSSRSQLYEAINVSRQAVALAEHSNNDHYKGMAYNNMAGAYTDAGDIEKAYAYYLRAIAAYERLDDKKHLAAVYANILGIFYSIGHSPERALEYGNKAIEVSRSINDYIVLEEALTNTAAVYLNLGKSSKALMLLTESMKISRRLNDNIYYIKELIAYNNTLALLRRYNEMPPYTQLIFKLSNQLGDKGGLANAEYFAGSADFDAKNYASAKQHLLNATALAHKTNQPQTAIAAYDILSDIELITGDISKYRDFNELEDSVRAKQHADQILINTQELETKYNVSKKEAAIVNLNKEKQIQALTLQERTFYIVVLTTALCALLIVGWLVRANSIRKEKLLISERELKEQQIQVLEKEKELMSAQALMKGQEAERSRLAKDLHDGLGGILTGTKFSLSSMKQNMIISAENAAAFEKTMNMLDQSITELRRVAHNMMPESLLKLSINDALLDYCQQVTDSGALKVTYQSFGIDNLTADEAVKIAVYRIVQELINNVVKHAAASSAMVQITRKEETLGITVEDDGKGFSLANLSFAEGMGYKNLKSRVDFLKGNIDVKSEPGKGTSVFIQLPV